jgi:hypothetical protein
MRTFTLLLMWCISGSLFAQVSAIQLGMSEAEVLMYLHPREYQEDFDLVEQTGTKYRFLRQDTDTSFREEVIVKLSGGVVSSIRTTRTAYSLEMRKTMWEYYREMAKGWEAQPEFEENTRMAAMTAQSFRPHDPQTKAFTDPDMTQLMVLVCYNTETGETVFSQLQRAFQ